MIRSLFLSLFRRPGRSPAVVAGILGLLAVPAAHATVSSTMSYQGVLTDNSGAIVPDGSYDLAFGIYQLPSGGAAVWTESQPGVLVNRGGFSVILGSVNPLGISFDEQLYLGVGVNGGAELTPRVPLTASPSALALRIPYRGITSGGIGLELDHTGGGYAFYADPAAWIGGGFGDGFLAFGALGAPYAYASIEASSFGGSLLTWVPGHPAVSLFPYSTTNSGAAAIYNTAGNQSIRLYGDVSGVGDPLVLIQGASRSASFSMGSSGNGSVGLPANAISAAEELDEPGIAQNHLNGSVVIATGATMTDLVSVSITTPADGYIVVEADGMHGIGGNDAAVNEANFTIKDTPGGALDTNHWFVSGFGVAPNGLTRFATSMRRTYFKAAGTYTFYFQANANNPSGFSNYIWDPTITATFIPTSYGTVTTVASRGFAGAAGLAARPAMGRSGPGGERVSSDAVNVDLRELELRAARLREVADQAELDMMKARLAQAAPKAKQIMSPRAPSAAAGKEEK